uniref:Plasmid pRiA4b Orf3-like domain-containing protein n=1 Tax=Graphocephala atropunctata TaxID=36148 RepID=A0A1B6LKE4_9HEMI
MGDPKAYQLKITLEGIRPQIWRRIQIPGYWSFRSLHNAIQDAMGWRNCHNYYFQAWNHKEDKKYTIDPFDNIFEGIADNNALIRDYFAKPKDKAYYEYDMGDSWAHVITLEKIVPEHKQKKYPICLDGKRACPPENAGGIDQYKYIVKVMKDRKHAEYDHYKSWIQMTTGSRNFRPEHFNPKTAFKNWKCVRAWGPAD